MIRSRSLCLGLLLACLGTFGEASLTLAEETPPELPLEATLLDPPATGLAVTQVVEGSQAARAGLGLGDVIVAYDGAPTPTAEALAAAKERAASAGKASVSVRVVRADGTEAEVVLEPGPIGVNVAPVEKGKGVEPLPPATVRALDLSRLDAGPMEDWYTFHLGEGPKKGFEHAVFRRENGRLVLRREVAFDGGEQWGINHFDVTITLTDAPLPRLVELRFENPVTGYVGEGRVEVLEDGTREIRYASRNTSTDESEEHSTTLPLDLPTVPTYLVETLACFMPREAGACLQFRPLIDGWGTLDPRAALLCVGLEELALAGTTVPVWRYEHRGLGGTATGTFWVDAAGHVVKADYAGPVALRATAQEALADLHEAIEPRSGGSPEAEGPDDLEGDARR